ncbi:MAG: hypothetical protein J7J73_01575 [Deltaproteobacteria bacterium]|nr:hypothetical protein [Deltaproteobacteria bacterium]
MLLKEGNFRLFLPYIIACIILVIIFFSYKPKSKLELPHIKTININMQNMKIEHRGGLYYYYYLPNPFVCEKKGKELITQERNIVSPRHTLSLIIIGREKKCIIDGKTMRIGEKKDELKVLKIERNSVIVLENGKKKRLNIK